MSERKKRRRHIWIAIGVVIFVLVVWAALGFGPYVLRFPLLLDWGGFPVPEKAGEFGDSFGFANSFVSSLALVFIIVAIFLQSHELKLQRGQLHLQRRDMKESQKIWKETAEAQKLSHQALRDTAQAQKESQELLRRQANALLLTAYLNGLISQQESAALSDEWYYETCLKAQSQIDQLLPQLREMVNAVLKRPLRVPPIEELLANNLQGLCTSFKNEWATCEKFTWENVELAKGYLRKLHTSFQELFPRLKVDPYHANKLADSLRSVFSHPLLKNMTEKRTVKPETQYEDLRRLGDNLLWELELLIKSYRSEAEKKQEATSGQ